MIRPLHSISLTVLSLLLVSCNSPTESSLNQPSATTPVPVAQRLQAAYSVSEQGVLKSVGQLIYVPVYSGIPFGNEGGDRLLSATLSIRNTSLLKAITVTRVYYYDNDGILVKDFTPQAVTLGPLASLDYFVPERDHSGGRGANYIVEWSSAESVNAPLVEAVMVGVSGTQAMAFSSKGVVIGVQLEAAIK